MAKKPVSRPMYEEMADTSWITGLRGIGDKGNQGILDNYNKVNVFDDQTQADLNGRVNSIYNRALGDFDRDYRETMGKTLANDYGRFGTTGATPSLYNRDVYNLQQQRKLADMQYNKASTYDQFLNNELQRRYDTMNMFKGMSDMGKTPYQQDLANWQIRNTNKDRQWMNDIDYNNYKNQRTSNWITSIPQAAGAIIGGIYGGPAGSMIGGQLGKSAGSMVSGLVTGPQQTYTSGLGNQYGGMDLMGGISDIYNMLGGSATNGQSWGDVLGGYFGRGNSSTGSNGTIYNNMSNVYSGNALQDALNDYLGGGFDFTATI